MKSPFKSINKTLGAFAIAFAFLLLIAAKAANAEVYPQEVRIGYQKGVPLLLLAKKQGVIEKRLKTFGVENVKWVEFQFGPPMLEALGAGAIDLASVGDTPPIFAQAAGARVVYVATTPSLGHAVLVPKASAIKTLADLKGKRIAFGRGSSAHNVITKALALAGLTLKDIEPIYLAPADATAAFNGGKVDAWVVWDPYFAIAQEHYNARAIVDTSDKRLESASYFMSRQAFATQSPQILTSILDEIASLGRWANQHQSQLASIASEATGIDATSWSTAFTRSGFTLEPVGAAQINQQQNLANNFYAQGIVPRQINVSDIVWKWDAKKQ